MRGAWLERGAHGHASCSRPRSGDVAPAGGHGRRLGARLESGRARGGRCAPASTVGRGPGESPTTSKRDASASSRSRFHRSSLTGRCGAVADEGKESDTGVGSGFMAGVECPRWLMRSCFALVIAGQVIVKTLTGKIHVRNVLEQLASVGPRSLSVSLLTSCFVGMVFTIQFTREFARLGLTKAVGGVLSLALSRELIPVITAVIMAGRVGSSYAAELGTMQVSEQIDSLRMLNTDPIYYLVTPRVIACALALPVLSIFCFAMGMAASAFLADAVYNVGPNIILDSAAKAMQRSDLVALVVKAVVFGAIISGVSCSWGMTTRGGAKGVGESTTSAVVISLVAIFIADFVLSFLFFNSVSSESIKACMV